MKIIPNYAVFQGELIRDNEIYTVTDNKHLKNMVVSQTVLKPRQKTTGHKHDGIEEIYIFHRPAFLEIDGNIFQVEDGNIVLIDSGEFHRVHNPYSVPCTFTSIFQTYERPKA